MKRLMSCVVAAAMVLAAVPGGSVTVRADASTAAANESSEKEAYEAQERELEATAADILQPVGGLQDAEAVYIEDGEGFTEPEVKVESRLFYSGQESFWAKCASTNGRTALSKQAQKDFYDKIDAAATAFMESTTDIQSKALTGGSTVYYPIERIDEGGDKGLSSEELLCVYKAFDYDHPAYYWIDNRMVYSDDYLYLLTAEDYALSSVRSDINEAIIAGVSAYKERADYAVETIDKIAVIHDAIVEDIDYAYKTVDGGRTPESAKWAHSVHGVFSSHKSAVCEGYADTFAMMMNYMGIPNYYVIGNATNSSASSGGHAWNMVSADGSRYMYMDLTWDDLTEKGWYNRYFGMPKSDFEANHTAYTPSSSSWLYSLPTNVADSLAETYYCQAGYYFDGTDADTAAKRMRTKAQRFGNMFSFMTDSKSDISEICKKWGQSGGYSYYTISYLGTEYYVYVKTFTDKTDITGAAVTFLETSGASSGSAAAPEPIVTCNGVRLVSGLNYTVSYSSNTSAGTGSVTVTGCGNYSGSAGADFTIDQAANQNTPKSMADIFTHLAKDTFEYNGSVIKPQVTVKDGDETLEEGVHYTVSLDESKDVGEYEAVISGMGDYSGSVSLSYTITPTSILAAWVRVESVSYTYDGTEKKPAVTVSDGKAGLVEGKDYTVSYSNNIAAGNNTARVIVEGTGNYTGKVSKSFTIDAASLADAQMTLSQDSYVYDGTAKTPAATLVLGGRILAEGTDYDLTYTNNTDISENATVTAIGRGNYSGTKEAVFEIYDAHVHELELHKAVEAGCTWDGKKAYWECKGCGKLFEDVEGRTEVTEESLVIKASGHSLLHIGAEQPTYDVEGNIEYWVCEKCFKYFSDPLGIVEISEKETLIEKLTRKNISGCAVSGLGAKAWTGSQVKPVITVKLDGETLKSGTDYAVEYRDNVNAGAAKVIITGTGSYEGTDTKSFVIKKVRLKYRAYVQKKGWMSPWIQAKIGTENDKKTFAGTTDDLRMETIQMQLSGVGGAVKYRAYVEKMGWTQWATTADTTTYAGTKGLSRRVEMIQLTATGQVARLYDMYYRTYCEKFGWLGWAGDKEKSGSAGYARKLEAFQVQFVPKGTYFDKGKLDAFRDKTKEE